jgi:hypothetical protein
MLPSERNSAESNGGAVSSRGVRHHSILLLHFVGVATWSDQMGSARVREMVGDRERRTDRLVDHRRHVVPKEKAKASFRLATTE